MQAKRCAVYGTLGWCLLWANVAGQTPPQNLWPDNPGLNLRVETTLVQIPVTVTDSLNRFILGLKKEDFQLFEDGAAQNVVHFLTARMHRSRWARFSMRAAVWIISSGLLEAAVAHFLKAMSAGDAAFLVEFMLRLNLSVGFTSNAKDIQNALTAIQPGGLTAMLDAINLALREMKKAKNPRKAIVIVSDGGDNNSKYTAAVD